MCETVHNEFPEHFAIINKRETTAWNLICGHVMTGTLVCPNGYSDTYTVVRPDGTSCHVPTNKCRPATEQDVLDSIAFYSNS
jgi:hypothetical protein